MNFHFLERDYHFLTGFSSKDSTWWIYFAIGDGFIIYPDSLKNIVMFMFGAVSMILFYLIKQKFVKRKEYR